MKRKILAADLDDIRDDDELSDSIDGLADSVDDIKDSLDDITEDDPDIEIDNNISDHYIAECDSCHEVFISAVMQSDQDVSSIQGICPLCGKETEQYLKWVIKDVEDADELE